MFRSQHILVMVFHVLYLQVRGLPTKSHYGTEFYLHGCHEAGGHVGIIVIDIASKVDGTCKLDVPYLGIIRHSTITRGITTLQVNGYINKLGTFLENRGIHIRTDVSVAVYVTCFPVYDCIDSYLALPITALGTTYKVASYDSASSDYSYLSIVGVTDDTLVTTNFTNMTSDISHLQPFTIRQIESTKDFTNTEIVSDKIVSVISGSSCAHVPHNVPYCNYFVEQMIPVKYWAKNYIVPPIFPKLGFVLKILTTHNETFCLKNNTNTLCTVSNGSPHQEFLMGTEPVVVTSLVPISTVQFGLGRYYDKVYGGVFMTVIPAVEQYLNEYYFVVPSVSTSLTSYLSIIIPSSQIKGIRLDGYPLINMKQYGVTDPFRDYSVFIVNTSVGYHELYHTNQSVKFGVTVYGLSISYQGLEVGCGFPAGFGFATDTEQAETTTTNSPTGSSPLTSINASTRSPTTAIPDNITRSTCYSCDDMSHVELCDVIQRCQNDEICYLEKYATQTGSHYKSGCMGRNQCQLENQTKSDVVCLECCHNNYCNNRGCGESRFPDRNNRGPMCFDCQHVLSPELCNRATLCLSEEVCSIEQYRWGNDYHYKMGCTHHSCTPIRRAVIGSRVERSTPICSSCCTDDFCNDNCTKITQPAIIG